MLIRFRSRPLKRLPLVLALAFWLPSADQANAQKSATSKTQVLLASDVDWQKLNPARGDKSPQAATLWGDRNGTVATGFLVKFVDGFSSPPHIHNVTYKGVVIRGLVHNDDPDAKPMWMAKGSFWTQPAGEPHITAAMGSTIAFIEIDKGPYLVKPIEDAFDKGERPVNIDASNLVWLKSADTTWVQALDPTASPEISFLWGKPDSKTPNGTMIRLPAGFKGTIQSPSSPMKAVIIEGQTGLTDDATLTPGSYFSVPRKTVQNLTCEQNTGCTIYVKNYGKFVVKSSP